ncbi:MAG: lectin-like protein [Myxococcota bacterium]
MAKLATWLSAVVVSLSVALISACSSGERSPAVQGDPGDMTPANPLPNTQRCDDGKERECGVTLSRQGDVVNCYHGTQTCVAGAWSECANGVTEQMTLSSGERQTLALSAPVDCVNNPCNPFCKNYDEKPAVPVTGVFTPTTYTWSTGTLSSFPGGLAAKGLKEPCTSGYDCQFNQKCTEVVTASSCSHSKCSTGGALVSTCDPCVTDICATKPNCCAPPANACGHDVCEVGKYLKSGCSTCVDKVCAKDSSCCSKKGSWDADCVALAKSECGVTCPCAADEITSADKTRCYFLEKSTEEKWTDARTKCRARGTSWDLATVNDSTENNFIQARVQDDTWMGLNATAVSGVYVWSDLNVSTYRNWHSGQPDKDGSCVYLENNEGDWYDNSCNNKRDYICEGPAKTGSSSSGSATATWDQSCVDAVKTTCAATCGAGNPPAASGKCTPWLPGEKDTTCADIDLAVGVPCDDTIPVCNHGTKTAPAGIKVVHFPANSAQYPKCAPDLTHPQMKTCTTTAAIPPGECIDLKGCTGLTGNREIMVNPQGISGALGECNCRDNWSLYSGGKCGAPACSGSSSTAAFKPVNMLIMFDKSGSMSTTLSGGGTRWSATTGALKAFFSDAGSAGLGVALRFFPDDNPTAGCNDSSCDSNACSDPLVEVGKLTAAASPTDAQEKLLLDAINATSPGGSTPTYVALDGALDWAFESRAAKPDEIHVVVLVTDGQPTKCNTDWSQIRQLSTDAYNNYGTRTYVIGIQGSNITDLDLLANAGGTGKAFVATGSNATQMQQELTKALQSIAGQNVSCTFSLANSGSFDPNNVSVVYTAGSGTSQTLPKVPTAASCGTGWYYDNNTNPTKATLCPSTCSTVQADAGALVQVQAGCPGVYTASTSSQQYQGVCPSGTFPQWGYFTYNTSAPGDSSVVFSVRAASTMAGLATATPKTLATAKSTPTDTQVCTKTGPAGCPIDLYALLGTSAKMPFLQLDVAVNPTSSKDKTATVNNWEVTYSCPPSE